MKVSEALGGIGSAAISAVPVFEKTKATWGNWLMDFSTANCIACDWVKPVLGMRSACMAMFFSSRVGMNSWPRSLKRRNAPPKRITAPAITGRGEATARLSNGA